MKSKSQLIIKDKELQCKIAEYEYIERFRKIVDNYKGSEINYFENLENMKKKALYTYKIDSK